MKKATTDVLSGSIVAAGYSIMSRNYWIAAAFFLMIGFRFFRQDLELVWTMLRHHQQNQDIQKVETLLRDIEDSLLAGLIPSPRLWDSLKLLKAPWGKLASESLIELRTSGGALLPTLKRLRALAEEQRATVVHARAKSSQALAQAGACSLLVPLLGVALYFLLPGMEKKGMSWPLACGGALILNGIGSIWMLQISQNARWGGLKAINRSWILTAQCAGERFLALVRAGVPPDLAWVKACKFGSDDAGGLTSAWGHSIWESPKSEHHGVAERTLIALGTSIRKSVQVSLMEGRPCVDRVETALEALRQDMKAQVERELVLLPTRTLKPLFICVAPSVIGLVGYGIWLASMDSIQGALNVF